MESMSSEDRAFLDENFKRFGSGWAGGLAELEAQFSMRMNKSEQIYELHLRHRSAAAVGYVVSVDRETGGMSNTGEQLPEARALTGQEWTRVDEVLSDAGSLLLLEPLNQKVVRLNLRNGAEALTRDPLLLERYYDGEERCLPRRLQGRMLDGLSLLYFINPTSGGNLFCLALDLELGCVADMAFVDLPPLNSRLLGSEERRFLNKSLEEHGDFGVYGSLTAGLNRLLSNFNVQLKEDDDDYFLSASPKDGHGHFFDFTIAKGSGEIRGVMAGHEEPEPDWDEEPADPGEEFSE